MNKYRFFFFSFLIPFIVFSQTKEETINWIEGQGGSLSIGGGTTLCFYTLISTGNCSFRVEEFYRSFNGNYTVYYDFNLSDIGFVYENSTENKIKLECFNGKECIRVHNKGYNNYTNKNKVEFKVKCESNRMVNALNHLLKLCGAPYEPF